MHSVYLNHAGTSWPKPAPVRAAVQSIWNLDPIDWADQFVADHLRIANALGIRKPAELLLTPSCTTALSVAVNDHYWNSGDRVLISAFEHHALHRPVAKLTDQGVEVDVLPHLDHEPIILEALEDELKKGGVKLVAITAASNVTGELTPYHDVIDLAHRYESKVLLDAAQVAGWFDLDLPSLGADLVTFAGHKGPQGPWGIGGLYVAEGLMMNSPAAVCEITYDKSTGKPKPPPSGPGYCDVGSVDRLALAGLAAGFEWLGQPARGNRLTYARSLSQQFYVAASELSKVRLYGVDDMQFRMPTVAFSVDGIESIQCASQFRERQIVVAGGMQCAPLAHKAIGTAPEGVVRISVGPMTTQEDIEAAVNALVEIAG